MRSSRAISFAGSAAIATRPAVTGRKALAAPSSQISARPRLRGARHKTEPNDSHRETAPRAAARAAVHQQGEPT